MSFRKIEGRADHLLQHGPDRGIGVERGWPVGVGDRGGLGHIAALRELHLDRVDAVVGLAVVARRPAALEAAVDDMALTARRADIRDDGFEFGGAGRTAIGPDVELRQLAIEQAGDVAADRMRVVEDDATVCGFQSVEFGR